MREMIKKGVIWAAAATGAALATVGVVSSETWAAVVTPDLLEAVTGVVALIVGGVVAKLTNWLWGKVEGRVG